MVPFSIRGCWGQPMLLFWKLVDESQMPKPQEYADTYLHYNLKIVFSWSPRSSKYICQIEFKHPVFWEKWWLQNFILNFIDLYQYVLWFFSGFSFLSNFELHQLHISLHLSTRKYVIRISKFFTKSEFLIQENRERKIIEVVLDLPATLESGINIPLRLLIFWILSRGYGFILDLIEPI